jgi:hypothetical protein
MSPSPSFRLAPASIAGLALSIALAGCASMESHGPKRVAPASPEQRASMFDQVAALQGTWESTDAKGVKSVASVFSVSSNGSIVREVMFPGSDHEMTNVYHMDGPSLMCTHYCAMGNQPHMRATSAEKGRIHFAMDSVSNFTADDADYMGDLVLEWIDKNHLRCHWTAFRSGKTTHQQDFDLVRKA